MLLFERYRKSIGEKENVIQVASFAWTVIWK